MPDGSQKKQGKGIWSDNTTGAKSSGEIKPDNGWQLVKGQITAIKDSRKYRWLILDGRIWIGIPRDNFDYFSPRTLAFKIGEKLSVRGFAYHSHGKLRMKLNHPAMINH